MRSKTRLEKLEERSGARGRVLGFINIGESEEATPETPVRYYLGSTPHTCTKAEFEEKFKNRADIVIFHVLYEEQGAQGGELLPGENSSQ